MTRLSVVLLVDPQGRVLLQERDENAPTAPDQWGMVGGHVEDGEEFEPAIYRELEEETGLHFDGGLALWRDERYHYSTEPEPFHFQVWTGATRATDADIVLGEGRQIVFVAPEDVPSLDTTESCSYFVPAFLASQEYAALVESLRS